MAEHLLDYWARRNCWPAQYYETADGIRYRDKRSKYWHEYKNPVTWVKTCAKCNRIGSSRMIGYRGLYVKTTARYGIDRSFDPIYETVIHKYESGRSLVRFANDNQNEDLCWACYNKARPIVNRLNDCIFIDSQIEKLKRAICERKKFNKNHG